MEIKDILAYVRRTNPEMTEERLIEELKVNEYSTRSLSMVVEYNGCKNNPDMVL